jgi:NAD(P)-dependent dehydrogenase (short-subunit alcohol dehydrogenase family)
VSRFDLPGKAALVTGGSCGIGRVISEDSATHDASVVIYGGNTAPMQETIDEIMQRSGRAACLQADVSDEAEVIQLCDQVTEQFGGLDILVNNAGIDPHYASMEKTDRSECDRMIGINLTGVLNCCRHLGALLIPRTGGSIINISSVAEHTGLKRPVPYSALKGGVERLTKSLAHDRAEHGNRVNAIAYGFVETDLTAGIVAHPPSPKLLAGIPMGRFGRTDEVHGAAVFLASSASSYVTGHSLMVDVGWTAT